MSAAKKKIPRPESAKSSKPAKAKDYSVSTLATLKRLHEVYPDAHCELLYENPFELLCATILSAQCTDERVNKVTPALFEKFPTPQKMSAAPVVQIEKLIGSINFFRNKARALKECSEALVSGHGGNVPKTLDELILLRGVGRKTANVVLGNSFAVPSLVVDTHVGRLARRLGWTQKLDPVEVERDLMGQVPPGEWTMLSHLLIFHGRRRCKARNPDCENCEIASFCRSFPITTAKARK